MMALSPWWEAIPSLPMDWSIRLKKTYFFSSLPIPFLPLWFNTLSFLHLSLGVCFMPKGYKSYFLCTWHEYTWKDVNKVVFLHGKLYTCQDVFSKYKWDLIYILTPSIIIIRVDCMGIILMQAVYGSTASICRSASSFWVNPPKGTSSVGNAECN